MAKMVLTDINVGKAENGTIIRLSFESMKIGAPTEFDSKEYVFENTEDATKFINEKTVLLTRKSN